MVESTNKNILYTDENITILVADNESYIEESAKFCGYVFSNSCPITLGLKFSYENPYKNAFTCATISFKEKLLICMIENKTNKIIGNYLGLSPEGNKELGKELSKNTDRQFNIELLKNALKMVEVDESELPSNYSYLFMLAIDPEHFRKGYGTKIVSEALKYKKYIQK